MTDARIAGPRPLDPIVEAALSAGAQAIQIRDKSASPRELAEMVRRFRAPTADAGALLFVNDRLDVALATGADGVHLGADDIPVAAARRVAPDGFLIGYSTDDPGEARSAEHDGADYIGCGAVFGTSSKDVGDEVVGTDRLDEVARSVRIPVVGIGGVTPERVAEIARTSAAGVAVVGALMQADDPGEVVRLLLRPFADRDAVA